MGRCGGTKWLPLSCAASAFHGEMTRKGHGMGTIHDLRIRFPGTAGHPATTIYFKSMTTVTEIGSLISRRPEIRGGRPCITGTGVSVRRIAQWHNMGLIPEEIVRIFGHLSLAQVHAAPT